jgi:hypothetical protein
MADGTGWKRYQNDLWHWFKHTQPFLAGGALIPAEMPGIASEDEYLGLARAIAKKAADGAPGTEVAIRAQRGPNDRTAADIREGKTDALLHTEYLVWYLPPGASRGVFLVVGDGGGFGELRTMFVPDTGRAYFLEQDGAVPLH